VVGYCGLPCKKNQISRLRSEDVITKKWEYN